MAGQLGIGLGKMPASSSRSTRWRVASTSVACSSPRRSAPSRPPRSARTRATTSSSSGENGSPSQFQSSVRSFGTVEKVTPWSTAWMWPPAIGSRWPPFRSVLFTIASKTAIRRRRASPSMTSRTTSTASSTSIHCWMDPSPNGPSRSRVGGTMLQPVASETRNAATSRRVSVPIGKSNSGCSPRVGFQTARSSPGASSIVADSASSSPTSSAAAARARRTSAAASAPGGRTRTTIALFDEPISAPMTSSSPSRRAARTASASAAGRAPAMGSVDVGAVLAGADVAARIERVAAQRARRTARPDDPERPLDERPGGVSGEAHPQEVGPVLVVVLELQGLRLRLLGGLAGPLGPRLDEDPLGLAVPAQRQRAGPECLVERLVERTDIGIDRGRRVLDDPMLVELDEEPTEPLGEDRDLGLLEDHADHAPTVAGLQEERPVAGLADRAGRETIGALEDEEAAGHDLTVPPQPTDTWIVWWPRAPSGAGWVTSAVCTVPVPSVARTWISQSPAGACQL